MQENTPNTEVEVEFVGMVEEVTMGWTGPTDDFIDGDWTP
ncbi:hypothetical protein B0I33_101528 [Prauserella shujinwangii]|uniref:Uncharacterized protein n=1 Tax=Prauserella shujinwangii TaxID=1453103 RepID=A0A2T0M3P2_9PSEU|nr:hypothetical protein B0I33_101528 [Prauserella shujinwangii]